MNKNTQSTSVPSQVVDAKVVLNRSTGRAVGNAPNKIAECTVGDETGVIVLTARNEQVDIVKPGKSIILRNAKIDMFHGSMRLGVNQWGKVEESAEAFDFEPLVDNNLSMIEFELVPLPAPGEPPATDMLISA